MALNHFLQVPLTDAQVQSFENAQGTLDHIENFAGSAIVQCDPTGPNITASVNGANVFQARANERFAEISEPGLSSVVRCAQDSVETYVGGNLRNQLSTNKFVMKDQLGNQRLVVSDLGVIVNNSFALPTTASGIGNVLTFVGGPGNATDFLPFAAATPELIANASDPATQVSVETAGFVSASVGVGKVVLVADDAGYTLLKAPGAAAPMLQLFDNGTTQLDIPGTGQAAGASLLCRDGVGTCSWGVPTRIEDSGDPNNSFVVCGGDDISIGTNYPTGRLILGIAAAIVPGQVLTAIDALGTANWVTPVASNPFNQSLNTTNAVTFASVSTPTLGAATTNVTGTLRVSNAFNMPTVTGANTQVLTSNGVGGTTWAATGNPFNQSLNTADSVTFSSVNTAQLTGATTNVTGTLRVSNAFNMPTGTGTNTQVLTSNGAGGTAWQTITPGIFSQVTPATVANTAAETTLINTVSSLGNLTLAPNSVLTGYSFQYNTGGVFRTNAATTWRFRLKAGLLTIFDSGALTVALITVPVAWNLSFSFTYIGANTMITNCVLSYNNGALVSGSTTQQSATFNPALSATIDCTVQWTTANANNTITSNFGVMSKLY